MTSQFLEDLTRAGSAVWEQYLAPYVGMQATIPPAFPEWNAIPEVHLFQAKYGAEYDWRLWLAWSTGFGFLATSIAAASDQPHHFDTLDKFAQLVAIHMGRRCPGMHTETDTITKEDLRDRIPDYPAPIWVHGQGSPERMERFRFEMAAYQGWQMLEASLIPERRPTDERLNEIMALGTDLETQLFGTTDMSTLMGLMVLTMHLATLNRDRLSPEGGRAADRVLCATAHGTADTIQHYMMQWNNRAILNALFGNINLN